MGDTKIIAGLLLYDNFFNKAKIKLFFTEK
jgi:hypothetical protein